ncbi:hypothetical protein [Limosilactobacillus caviae]|uniref:hypothetical protein n=1 Tax=Limosilactobacillus caviae TaxID=1769424 RepID=UPI001E567687|nr:hypothetical protein [Limosilactobacillus caviae]MCD7123308.1 hypothetical protein [Limosilactobacillus caviae]
MLRFLNNVQDLFTATIILLLFHIAALISLIKLALGKVFEYIFKLLLLIIFIFLLVPLSAFDPKYTQSWNDIKEIWEDFVDLVLYFDYQELAQWYKNLFSKDEKEAEIDS